MARGFLIWLFGATLTLAGLAGFATKLNPPLPYDFLLQIPAPLQTNFISSILLSLGLLTFLVGLLYLADTLKIMDDKILSFDRKFSEALEQQTQTKVRKERMEAQRDLAEGVHSVLHSPINLIKSHLAMFKVGLSVEQVHQKADDITRLIERIERFVLSLRSTGTTGQVAQPRCEPEKILKSLLPEWTVRIKKYGAQINDKIAFVHEISIPERDVRTIFKGVLEFSAERLTRNLYQKNVMISLQPEKDGIHFSVLDNMPITEEELKNLTQNMHLAIASGTLERNYCNLDLERVLEGGLRISFDLVKTEDQTLDSLTATRSRTKVPIGR